MQFATGIDIHDLQSWILKIFSKKGLKNQIKKNTPHLKPITMAATLHKVWIHVIFTTRQKKDLIDTSLERRLHAYMRKQLYDIGCPINIINGTANHVHCLFLLDACQSTSAVVKQIKGSSSHFINHNNLTSDKFSWQSGYTAYSVSESAVPAVFKYIQDQKYVHKKITLEEETEEYTAIHLHDNFFH